jgi:hypothetical protein
MAQRPGLLRFSQQLYVIVSYWIKKMSPCNYPSSVEKPKDKVASKKARANYYILIVGIVIGSAAPVLHDMFMVFLPGVIPPQPSETWIMMESFLLTLVVILGAFLLYERRILKILEYL